jgi:hypothetical protein
LLDLQLKEPPRNHGSIISSANEVGNVRSSSLFWITGVVAIVVFSPARGQDENNPARSFESHLPESIKLGFNEFSAEAGACSTYYTFVNKCIPTNGLREASRQAAQLSYPAGKLAGVSLNAVLARTELGGREMLHRGFAE